MIKILLPRIFRPGRQSAPGLEPDAGPSAPVGGDLPRRGAEEQVSSFSVPMTYMESRIPEIDSAYGYGHLDGRRRVEPSHFESFIDHTVQGDAAERRVLELEARESELRGTAERLRTERADLAARTEVAKLLQQRSEEAEQILHSARSTREHVEKDLREHRMAGSRLYAAIYISAGLLFIFGDVVMTQRIVADALELVGTEVFGIIDESWVFATGLAMLSILLKPAYDRLVEDPYWKGRIRAFATTILLTAALAVTTLGILGAFRAEVHPIKAQIEELAGNRDLESAEKQQKIGALREQLLGSKLGALSFILSGVLFAVAGAVSLGIGVRHLQGGGQLRRIRRQDGRARDDRDRCAEELAAHNAELERARVRLADQPAVSELERAADAAREERRDLVASLGPIRTERLRSLYRDGYGLGKAFGPESAAYVQGQPQTPRPGPSGPRRKRPRAHLALRRAIRETILRPPPAN